MLKLVLPTNSSVIQSEFNAHLDEMMVDVQYTGFTTEVEPSEIKMLVELWKDFASRMNVDENLEVTL